MNLHIWSSTWCLVGMSNQRLDSPPLLILRIHDCKYFMNDDLRLVEAERLINRRNVSLIPAEMPFVHSST